MIYGKACIWFRLQNDGLQKMVQDVSRLVSEVSIFIREYLDAFAKAELRAQYFESFGAATINASQLVCNFWADFERTC